MNNPTKAAQYIPIALYNQSSFVQDRQIQDNIIVAHESFHHLKLCKTGKDGAFDLKLDMHKAYDHVEWSFLESVFIRMGLPLAGLLWL